MLLWEIVDRNRYGHEYVEATSMPFTSPDFVEAGMRCRLSQERFKNPVEFRRREVVNNDFPATSSFLDYDLGA